MHVLPRTHVPALPHCLPPGQVVASQHPDFQTGDYVAGFMTWAEYHLASGGQGLSKAQVAKGRPLSYYIGILGMPGGCCQPGVGLQ
jgi:NADPH-dependent curcumin reductase CurA